MRGRMGICVACLVSDQDGVRLDKHALHAGCRARAAHLACARCEELQKDLGCLRLACAGFTRYQDRLVLATKHPRIRCTCDGVRVRRPRPCAKRLRRIR